MADKKISATDVTATPALVGSDMFPIARSGDSTARRTTIKDLNTRQDVAFIDDYLNTGETTYSAAFTRALAAVSNKGVIKFGYGTYTGNFDVSGLGSTTYVVIEGTGIYSTILQCTSGVAVNCQGSSGVTVRDLSIDCVGNEIGLLLCRNTAGTAGAGGCIERIKMTGSPTIAGIFDVAYEVSSFRDVFVWLGRASVAVTAPCLLISAYNGYGADATDYVPAGGAMYEGTMAANRFESCQFVKDDNSFPLVSGAAVQIGQVTGLKFEDCYVHGAGGSNGIEYISQGRAASSYGIIWDALHFESNYPATTEGCVAMFAKQTGSAGSNTIENLVVRNSMFANKRGATHTGPYYTFDFASSATDYATLVNPTFENNKQAWGGGIRARVWKGGRVQHIPATMNNTGALTATDTTITLNTTATNDMIRIGDKILVGAAGYNDSDTHTIPEYREVIDRTGAVITLDDALDYDHPTADVIWVNPKVGGVTADGTEFQGVIVPDVTTVYSSNDKTVHEKANQRQFYGPAVAAFAKQSLIPIFRALGDEPGDPTAGMLAAATAHNAWVVTDLNGIGMTNFLAYRVNTAWWAVGMFREGSATYNPGDVAKGSSVTTTVTVTGAAVGDIAIPSLSIDNAGMTVTANITATDTATVAYANLTATDPLNLAEHTLRVIVFKR